MIKKIVNEYFFKYGKYTDHINKRFEKYCHSINFGKSLIFFMWLVLDMLKPFMCLFFRQNLHVLCVFFLEKKPLWA